MARPRKQGERIPLLCYGGFRTKISRYDSVGEVMHHPPTFVTTHHRDERAPPRNPAYIDHELSSKYAKRRPNRTRRIRIAAIMLVLLIVALYFCLDALAVDTVVDVGHTRYRGVASLEGVTSWKGMRYANRPIGKLRFAAPEDPLPDGRILDASKVGVLLS